MNIIHIFINSPAKTEKSTGILKRDIQQHFLRCCKTWKVLSQFLSYLNPKCYPIILSLSLQRETYIPIFHFISYLTDHQIQMLKKIKCERFTISDPLPVALYFVSAMYLLQLSVLFFPNNMKGSKRTTTWIDHLCSSTKKQAKN